MANSVSLSLSLATTKTASLTLVWLFATRAVNPFPPDHWFDISLVASNHPHTWHVAHI